MGYYMASIIETEWGFTVIGATELDKPVRKIPKNYRNVTGIAAHEKANGSAMYESSLERDYLTILEFCPEVDKYTVQPITLEWQDSNNKSRSYTPDTFVLFKKNVDQGDKPWLCEVKYRSDLAENWHELRPKFKAAIRFANAQGWRFKIMTEVEIQTTYMTNARFLLRYRNSIPGAGIMALLDEQLKKFKESTPSILVKAVFQDEWRQAQLIAVLWYLVATFQIGINLHQPITMDSQIWWKA